VAWSYPEVTRQPGIVLHLRTKLEPALQYLVLPGETVAAAPTPFMFPLPLEQPSGEFRLGWCSSIGIYAAMIDSPMIDFSMIDFPKIDTP
jgi:hypothetical protein